MRKRTNSTVLVLGDIAIFFTSLWLMLVIRHLSIPGNQVFFDHLVPFSILFIVWVFTFFIAGLYERHTVMFQRELPPLLFKTQIINVFTAVLFFYLIPYFGITPKTNLFIYLVISFGLVFLWRLYGYNFLGTPRRKRKMLLIGAGDELYDLQDECNNNPYAEFEIALMIDLDHAGELDLQKDLIEPVYSEGVELAAIDLRHPSVEPLLPHLYNFIFLGVVFFDIHHFYGEFFKRVPLPLLRYAWFLEHVSETRRVVYPLFKRCIDVSAASLVGFITLPVMFIAALLIKLGDGGGIIYKHTRIGKNNQPFQLMKFRTMNGKRSDGTDDEKRITSVGKFLRVSRIDELPQLWNVIRGDLSLIGPRPEIPEYVKEYRKQIPFYDVRHIIKPGLSGWAQIYHKTPPRHVTNVIETKTKLSYDLYYLTHRSVLLDLAISLKTIKALVAKIGAN